MNFVATERDGAFVVVDHLGRTVAGPFGRKNWAVSSASKRSSVVPEADRIDPNLRVEPQADGFAVIAHKDIIVGGPYDTEMKAQVQIKNLNGKAQRRANKTVRTCMCCRHPFDSAGIHNRLCNVCRHNNSDIVGGGSTGTRTQPRGRS